MTPSLQSQARRDGAKRVVRGYLLLGGYYRQAQPRPRVRLPVSLPARLHRVGAKADVLAGTVTTDMPARSWDPGQIGLGSDGQRYRDQPVRAAQ
jgi:hypothetical protein